MIMSDPNSTVCHNPNCPFYQAVPGTRYKTVLLFGAPGSGKGTQGKILGSIPGFYHSSTGDIFRSLDLQSEVGRLFWEYAGKGQLVPDDVVIRVWKQFIKGKEFTNDFYPETQILVLDGMPRNVNQAKLLEDTIEVLTIIHLSSDHKKMVERLKRRALKENRFDDANDVVIEKRLKIYENETRPILDYYPKELVFKVDAMQSQTRVLYKILEKLTPLKEKFDLQVGTQTNTSG
ncbi:MAG: adenylate kinase [Phycisphaerae bacterium]|jgi:adenylate kinase|nr:MAG: adenylate kinase [Phycisphaerae bacterium]